MHKELNKGPEAGNFPCTMKLANITPVYKKGNRSEKVIIDLSAYCQAYQVFKRCVYKQTSQYFEGIIY